MERVLEMRNAGMFYYKKHFASVECILETTIEILKQRIYLTMDRDLIADSRRREFYSTQNSLLINQTNSGLHLIGQSCQLIFFCTKQNSSRIIEFFESSRDFDFVQEIIFVECFGLNLTNNRYINFDGDHISQLSRFLNTNCSITLKDTYWIKYARKENTLSKLFRLWQDTHDVIGYSGLSYSMHSGECYRLSSNLKSGYSFLGLEFTIFDTIYLDFVISKLDVFWLNCSQNLVGSVSDQFFECLTTVFNLATYKMKSKHVFTLLKPDESLSDDDENYLSSNKSSMCLNDMFENLFNLDYIYFTKIIYNKKYFFV